MNARLNILNSARLGQKLNDLRVAIKNEASLIQGAMQSELAISRDPESVKAKCADELSKLWAWEEHLQRTIENECGSLPPVPTVEPDSPCLPRSRARMSQSLRDELGEDGDPTIYDLIAALFGAAIVIAITNTSELHGASADLQDELKKRLKPPAGSNGPTGAARPAGGGGTSTSASTKPAKPRAPAPGKRAKKDDEDD